MHKTSLRIGAGAGYSGDRIPPAVELADKGQLDYLVFECLAERTIALAQLERSKDPAAGFDPMLAARMRAVLPACLRHGTRIISNMGAANPLQAGHAVLAVARELGLPQLKVAVVLGDDVLATLTQTGLALPVLESTQTLADLQPQLISANAYLGAEALVPALQTDAQVIITGRVADPALFLAPLMHHFGWAADDWQRLGKGVLVGHLLECAAQITGGYFADPGYKDVPNLAQLGFPLAEVSASGDAVITKVAGSGGCVTVATCTEQLLYEIENPARYLQPDVVADFSQVQLTQRGPDRVQVTGGNGHPRTETLKVTLGYRDGFIGEGQISYAGPGAQARGQLALDVVRERLALAAYADYESRYDLIGVNAIFGPSASSADREEPTEVRARVALRVPSLQQAQHVAHEVEALYTNGPAGGGGATRAVREVIAAAAVLMPRSAVHTTTVLLTQDP
ncbi:acyclic terpene utilization AtuA family protein [Limnohabitans sp. G3-2]|uniref:acyclic terpene utilization AtuA family protein n=1 Tax=Limnohabitans sp. G3-2 TaxID=1100711 RepID=UPI000C1F28E5|nr:acyclic terpene utilization AtuA family protein [Limnohabitans sp. G3-2]PIT74083.1 ABC transporter substrate-binding protein [Limnohabitans sp. G3-2]